MKKLPKKLYHVTLDLKHDGVFNPRVPESRMSSEDSIMERICVSDSIEGCLTASPFGAHYLSESLMETDDRVKVFVIDTEKLGLTSSDVIFPDELYQSGRVDDASLTGEFWILKKIQVPSEDQSIIKIIDVSDEIWKPLIPFNTKKILQAEGVDFSDIESVETGYYSYFKEEINSLCMIEDIQFITL